MTSTSSTCRCRPPRICSGARPRWPTANTSSSRSRSPAMPRKPNRWSPRRARRTGTSSKDSTTASIRCSCARSKRCAAARSAASGTSKRRSTPICPTRRASCVTSRPWAAARSWTSAAIACTGSAASRPTSPPSSAPAPAARRRAWILPSKPSWPSPAGPRPRSNAPCSPMTASCSAVCAWKATRACSNSKILCLRIRVPRWPSNPTVRRHRRSSRVVRPRSTTSCGTFWKSSRAVRSPSPAARTR